MRSRNEDVFVRGSIQVICELFQVLRYNGVEACVPIVAPDGYCYLICLQGPLFDQLICSWKDRITLTLDPTRWPKAPSHDS